MADINNWVVTGRLTRDAEFRVLPSGTELVTFDIANNTGFGQYAKTLFITVNHWGKSAKNMLPYLTKGKGIAVSGGEVELQQWTSKQDGSIQKKVVVNTSKVDFLPNGSSNQQSTSEPQPQPQQDARPYSPEDDEVPAF